MDNNVFYVVGFIGLVLLSVGYFHLAFQPASISLLIPAPQCPAGKISIIDSINIPNLNLLVKECNQSMSNGFSANYRVNFTSPTGVSTISSGTNNVFSCSNVWIGTCVPNNGGGTYISTFSLQFTNPLTSTTGYTVWDSGYISQSLINQAYPSQATCPSGQTFNTTTGQCQSLPSTPAGCAYNNPPCSYPNSLCINNVCSFPTCSNGGVTCPSGQTCVNSVCTEIPTTPTCSSNQILVNNQCVTPTCSNGGVTCPTGQGCVNNVCTTPEANLTNTTITQSNPVTQSTQNQTTPAFQLSNVTQATPIIGQSCGTLNVFNSLTQSCELDWNLILELIGSVLIVFSLTIIILTKIKKGG